MLDIKVNADTPRCQIVATGSTKDLLVEICMVISSIYSTMHKQDGMMAEVFHQELQGIISNADSPVWQVDSIPGDGLAIFVPNVQDMQEDENG